MAQGNDVVINEIMADPSPGIALPEWEYIELYNTSADAININKWEIIIGKKELPFDDDIVIQPDGYLILCHNDAIGDLSQYGNCHGFSSFQITNSGSSVSLIDENDRLISTVSFDLSWHSATYKKDGGWSLEQIDAFNPCAGKKNWGSSIDRNGGSPGKMNSIAGENVIPPKLDHIIVSSHNEIEVFFNQNMNFESLQKTNNYIITELDLYPEKIETIKHKNDYVKLTFDYIFEEGKLYTLNINNVNNCNDIPPENEINARFGMPSEVGCNDIIINEILFHPISPGVEYLELYNRSDKIIDLKDIMFGTIKKTFPNPPDTTLKEICAESRIILPHSYIVLSLDQEIIKEQYLNSNPENNPFLDVESFPTLPNEEGHVMICDQNRMKIDEMNYSDKMHYDLLSITQGVSLERISTENHSLDENNWHSASFNFNYGTPGYRNSMAQDVTDAVGNGISIIPEVFSPDGDGYNDICGIHYKFDNNGYCMNVKIFNSDGLLVRNLFNDNLVSGEGVIHWDGRDDNNSSVSIGIYIIQTELFDLNGNVDRRRNVVVVATN